MRLKVAKLQKQPPFLKLIFKKPAQFSFYPGQYVDVELKGLADHDGRGKVRAFTIASSPTEDQLMIATRFGQSDFKTKLASLGPNDYLSSSHPVGTFILDETEPAVFIAGGVGITPFRSMIKYAVDQKLAVPITLIYSNREGPILFQDELDRWQNQLTNLKLIYHDSAIMGRLNKTRLQELFYATLPTSSTIYYLAGAPEMIDSLRTALKELGIDEVNIRSDYFDGY